MKLKYETTVHTVVLLAMLMLETVYRLHGIVHAKGIRPGLGSKRVRLLHIMDDKATPAAHDNNEASHA